MDWGAIYDGVLGGDEAAVQRLVVEAVEGGVEPAVLLKEALIPAMAEVGDRFERAEFFIPEMLLAARAMQAGLTVLKPSLKNQEAGPTHRVVVGTVHNDIHDLGKNLVAIMLGGAGFEVTDLGADVRPERFVEAVREHRPHIVGMSSLMTTTMAAMTSTIQALSEAGLREQVKIMIGGAPLTPEYGEEIGADAYAPDAWAAVKKAKELAGA
jgi:5-methyltetrahydrofolate--homocysteine methyltransferase